MDPDTGALTGGTFNYPAFTIEAKWKSPVRVKWINELVVDPVDCFYRAGGPTNPDSCNYLPHLLPVDQTLHWANPRGECRNPAMGPTDCRGDSAEPYDGPVPMIVHVHGAETYEWSDGYPEAWYLPNAAGIDCTRTGDPTDDYYCGGSFFETFEIEAGDGAQFFSFVSMLVCTNDGFTGLDAVKLPNQVGSSASWDAYAYDAGTELNTEDFADIVPPCPVLTGVPSTDPGTGASDPALAENGVITMHPGITGDDDLIAGLHGWSGPVARVTIERLD